MARDYKRRAPARKKKTTAPGWVWLLAGLTVGLFVAFLVYLNAQPPKGTANPPAQASKPAPAEGRKEAAAKPAPAPKPQATPEKKSLQYDFYTILPQFEVEMPEDKNPPREKPVVALATPGTYVLQVGSFKQARDAEARKAELALLGIVSSVQAVEVDATTYHRVRIGPLQDLEQLNRLRQTLRENGIDFMTLTLKGNP